MISMHASAVCTVRDGYTGGAIAPGTLECVLDGGACRPVAKREGYLVLLDLSPGRHKLVLRCRGYQEEWVEFEAGDGTRELDITMKPGEGYPFRRAVTSLTVTVLEKEGPAVGRQLWVAATGQELRIAQTRAEAGESRLRLYCKGSPPSGAYLIEDGGDSEIAVLRSIKGETGLLAAPLARSHSRGKRFLPAQRYHTGQGGTVTAVFRRPCAVRLYAEGRGLVGSLELTEGKNQLRVTL